MKPSEKLKQTMTKLALESVEGKDGERLQQFIDRGADPHKLLQKSLEIKDATVFRRLIRLGADISRLTFDELKAAGGEFAEAAAEKGMHLQQFLAYGVTEKNIRYVRLAVDNGADVNMLSGDPPRTLFHLMALTGGFKQEVADFLLTQGLDINAKDDEGLTPLHLALSSTKWPTRGFDTSESTPVIAFLLANGANPAIADKEKRTAFDILETITDPCFKFYKKALLGHMLRAVRPAVNFEPENAMKLNKSLPASKPISFKPKSDPK